MKFGQVFLPGAWAYVSNNHSRITRLCLVPKMSGVGGMVSFQKKISEGLLRRGIEVCYHLSDHPYQAVLVIGGTRDLKGLLSARKRGIPVIQRLDGMNWLHRRFGLAKTGWRHYLRAEYGNWLLALIRRMLSDRVVYQSEFSRKWWERVHGYKKIPNQVIYNGVDLNTFSPHGEGFPPPECWRVLLVEGSLMGGYEHGLMAAMDAARALHNLLKIQSIPGSRRIVELAVAGKVDLDIKKEWDGVLAAESSTHELRLNWLGLLPHDKIPMIDRSAHMLYSSDIHPACPNSVIEALACGLPVVAYDTGALPELVINGAGAVVAYGGNPWALDPPDSKALAESMFEILFNQEQYRRAARSRAETAFGLEPMVEAYLEFLGA